MIVRLLAVLAVLAVAAAGVTGWFWWNDPGSALARERDDVLASGETQIVELNTVDYRDLDAAFARWRSAATGPLLERLERNREADRQGALGAKTVTTARVVTAAVVNLNSHTGTANVIAALEISVSRSGAQPTGQISRLDVDLTRTPEGWKVSALEAVGT